MPQPSDDDTTPVLRIEVERTGGFAGLSRSWHVEPEATDREAWLGLIEDCPWRDASPPRSPTRGADRFQWRIRVDDPGGIRSVELTDDLDTAWRALIDAVRAGRTPPAGGAPGR
ncbi:protealysin inhibitor emfourin [Microbacterium oleivorans]|uniref:Uncharacterized protein n=1 Tax=Microbacterium oleivorans TaxID=273677 RepID=A0A7D5IX95_9MICO|nr:protealysin inhibitor emfourin [Microbacterium oleivorans]QLD12622.1 hypothetical protein HW566_13070 [Microbacterium oleivorans]